MEPRGSRGHRRVFDRGRSRSEFRGQKRRHTVAQGGAHPQRSRGADTACKRRKPTPQEREWIYASSSGGSKYRARGNRILGVARAAAGDHLVTAEARSSSDGQGRCWKVRHGKRRSRLGPGHSGKVLSTPVLHHWYLFHLQGNFPAFAEGGFHPPVRLGDVRDFTLHGIPEELAVVVNGHRAQEQPLGVLAGDAEIRAGGRAPERPASGPPAAPSGRAAPPGPPAPVGAPALACPPGPPLPPGLPGPARGVAPAGAGELPGPAPGPPGPREPQRPPPEGPT